MKAFVHRAAWRQGPADRVALLAGKVPRVRRCAGRSRSGPWYDNNLAVLELPRRPAAFVVVTAARCATGDRTEPVLRRGRTVDVG